jgi:phenylpropionate dioxygenase-like ring-hydroxylating dioxygenase large terminal subunit
MIPNQWYVILESNEVKRGKPVGVTRLSEKLVAWRDARGQVTVMRDLCPHRGVALSAGKLIDDCIECPFHGFQYDTTGACKLVPANGRTAAPPKALRAHAYSTREAHGFIYIWWGEPKNDLPPLPWFDNIAEGEFSTQTLRDHWTAHYSRAIENQLDVAHLPFVHRTTIGRGNQTLVNGPVYRVRQVPSGARMDIWFDNAVDRGQPPRPASEMPEPTRRPLLQFLFPNLWQNWLGDALRIVIAFVPIDDTNTRMYIRGYQAIVRAPILREVFNVTNAIGNFVIERQDRRVVTTQRPKRSDLRGGEKLIPGDGPIIEYRRIRKTLIEQAGQWSNP